MSKLMPNFNFESNYLFVYKYLQEQQGVAFENIVKEDKMLFKHSFPFPTMFS